MSSETVRNNQALPLAEIHGHDEGMAPLHFPNLPRAFSWIGATLMLFVTLSPEDAISNARSAIEFVGATPPGWLTPATVSGQVRVIAIVAALLLVVYGFWPAKRKVERLERTLGYEPGGISLDNGRVVNFSFGVSNKGSSTLSVSLVSAVLRVGDQSLTKVKGGRPALLSPGESAYWKIAPGSTGDLPPLEAAGTSVSGQFPPKERVEPQPCEAIIEIEYDDVPARGRRRSKLRFEAPPGVGGYSARLVDREEL